MADTVPDQVGRIWSTATDPFAPSGNVQRTPEAIAAANLQGPDYSLGAGVAGPNFSSGTATDRTLSAVSPIQGRDGQLGGGTIWAGRPHGGGNMQTGNVLGLPEVTQVRVTSPTFGTTPPSYATSVGDKPTHGADHQPFSDSGVKLTQPVQDRARRSETPRDTLGGLASMSMSVGTAAPTATFEPLSFTEPNKSVHGTMSLFNPRSQDKDAEEQLHALSLTLTDTDALKDLVLRHQDMGVMREYHQKENGFNEILHDMMDKGHITPEVANQLSQKMCARFYQHVTRSFNDYAMPIMIESFRANLINKIPQILTQLETAVKGIRLHVGAGSSDSGFDHIKIMLEINGTCQGIRIFNERMDLAVRNLSALAVHQLDDIQNIYGFLQSEISSSGALDSSSLDTGNADVKRLKNTIETMEATCILAACSYVQKTPPKKDSVSMKVMAMPTQIRGDADAKVARQLSEAFYDFMMQDTATFWPLIFVHGVLANLVLKKGMLVIPPSLRPEVFGQSLTVPEFFKERYDIANTKLYGALKVKSLEMCRQARAGRRLDFGEGEMVFIIADETDGMSVIWFYMLIHAQHTTITRLQLRDRLQHCAGLFTKGPLKEAVDKIRIDIELAAQFTLLVEPHAVLSVMLKTLANRDPIFLELHREYERLEGTMTYANGVSIVDRYLTKIETIARSMNKYEISIRNCSLSESNKLRIQANAFYGVLDESDPAPAPAPAPAPTPAPKKKKTPLVAAGEQGNLVCNAKTCEKMVSKDQCTKYETLLKTYPKCPAPVCRDCFMKMIDGKGSNDIELKTGGWTKYTAVAKNAGKSAPGKRTSALFVEECEKREEDPLDQMVRIKHIQDQMLEDEENGELERSVKLDQMSKISSMLGDHESVCQISIMEEEERAKQEEMYYDMMYSDGCD